MPEIPDTFPELSEMRYEISGHLFCLAFVCSVDESDLVFFYCFRTVKKILFFTVLKHTNYFSLFLKLNMNLTLLTFCHLVFVI